MAVGLTNMRAVGAGGSGGASVDAETLEDVLQVHLHGVDGAAEDGGDLIIGLAFGDPVQHLRLSWREFEMHGKNVDGVLVVRGLSFSLNRHQRR